MSSADVFYIDPKGAYLPTVVDVVREAISTEGLKWFRRFSDMREVLRTLTEDNESNEGTWGFGAKGSPARNLYTGYVALSLNENEIAAKLLSRAADFPSYAPFREKIVGQLRPLKEPRSSR